MLTDAKYTRYALKEILDAQTSFCHMTNGVIYAPRIPSARITFDFRSEEKYATARVKKNAVTRVATSGISAVAASTVRDP